MMLQPHEPNTHSRREVLVRAGQVTFSLSAVGLLGGCGGSDDPAPATGDAGTPASGRAGGTFIIATTFASVTEPHLLNDSPGIAIVQPTAAYLVEIDDDYQPVPSLAERWEPAREGREWTFTLRPDARFHSGGAVTAEDVAATFKRLVDPKAQSTLLATLSFLKPRGIEVVDERTVRFTLTRPVADFPYFTNSFQAGILPADYKPGSFAKRPDGAGPFKLVSFAAQGDARYEAFEDYVAGPKPSLQALVLKGYASAEAITPALQSGDADAVVLAETPQLRVWQRDEELEISHIDSAQHVALAMRVDQEPFSDVRIRQALALTLDRGSFVQGFLGGRGALGEDHVIAPIYREYTALEPARRRDVESARQLLRDAGKENLKITLTAPAELPDLGALAVFVKDQAREVGITVEVESLPLEVYGPRSAELPFQTYGWGHRNTASEFLNAGYRTGAAFNVCHWSNETFDGLVERFDATTDPAERKQLAFEIEQVMAEEVPAVIPFFQGQTRAVSKSFEGFEPSASKLMPVARVRSVA